MEDWERQEMMERMAEEDRLADAVARGQARRTQQLGTARRDYLIGTGMAEGVKETGISQEQWQQLISENGPAIERSLQQMGYVIAKGLAKRARDPHTGRFVSDSSKARWTPEGPDRGSKTDRGVRYSASDSIREKAQERGTSDDVLNEMIGEAIEGL